MLGALLVGVVCLAAGMRFPVALNGAWLLLAVPWYGYAIWWVDRNGGWTPAQT